MRHTLNSRRKSKTQLLKRKQRRQYRPFPYQRVAKMWEKGLTIARIAYAVDRVGSRL